MRMAMYQEILYHLIVRGKLRQLLALTFLMLLILQGHTIRVREREVLQFLHINDY